MRLFSLLLLLALPATASAARLLDVETAPAPPTATALAPAAWHDTLGFGTHFATTLGVGILGSTAGVLLAVPLTLLSNALVGQLPALLVSLLAGPALTALGAWLVGNQHDAGRYGYWGAFGAATVAHLVVFLVTTLALPIAVAWTNPVSLLLYSLVDGLFMTGAAVGTMHLFPRKAPAATVASFVPGVGDTAFIPLSTVDF